MVTTSYFNFPGITHCPIDSIFGKRVLTYWDNNDYSQMNGFMEGIENYIFLEKGKPHLSINVYSFQWVLLALPQLLLQQKSRMQLAGLVYFPSTLVPVSQIRNQLGNWLHWNMMENVIAHQGRPNGHIRWEFKLSSYDCHAYIQCYVNILIL